MAIDRTGISSLQTGAPEIKYTGDEGPKSPDEQLMASADPMLVEEYNKYVFEMEEQGLPAISFREFVQQIMSGMADGGIARLGYANGQRVGLQSGRWADPSPMSPGTSATGGMRGETARETGIRRAATRPTPPTTVTTADGPDTADDRFRTYSENIVDIRPPKDGGTWEDKRKKDLEKAKIRSIKPSGTVTQKILYGLLKNNPKLALQYLSTIKKDDEELWDSLPQELKNLVGPGTFGEADPSGMDLYSSWEDHPELSFDEWSMLTQIPGSTLTDSYGEYLAKRGKPGVKHAGNVGGLGDRYVKYEKNPDGSFKLKDGKKVPATDYYGNIKYGYMPTPTGGEGPIYYPGYVPGGIPSAAPGGITETAVATTDSFPTDPVTAALTNQYHIPGASNFYSNLASSMFNPTTNMLTLANGGRIPAAYGGIMDLDTGRRAYGLGSIFKKAARAVKKVAKSPIGKAALMAGLFHFGPGLLSGTGLGMGTKTGTGYAGWKKLLAGKMDPSKGGMNIWRGIAGASALGGLFTEDEEDEDVMYKDWLAKKQYWDQQLGGPWPTNPVQFSADGGRIGYANAGIAGSRIMGRMGAATNEKEWITKKKPEQWQIIKRKLNEVFQGAGGGAEGFSAVSEFTRENSDFLEGHDWLWQGDEIKVKEPEVQYENVNILDSLDGSNTMNINGIELLMPTEKAKGGRIRYQGGGYYDEEEEGHRSAALSAMYGLRKNAQEGGLMDLGGMEKDYREEGGFVPIGGQERADDVPARLSKNEFVFTADAVRAAGGGDIDKGAEVMENVMNNLEQGGQVSEESQGLEGARNMFATAQRLEGVM